ncbi:hypothetical protein K503DRAFT_800312 [Rhizopogon vinicolor AM-OR11-026]|uniref:Uncharacterized protein n=1 Tax=Rhizopogon vinicolor AM-OR11-026 TaxID=1314800 RepID=A0A1B7N169_9AGAM|nr:hypothetical protein K503DRAFT_800312 [Rhizopogon vinicolor AM-OR11-026]
MPPLLFILILKVVKDSVGNYRRAQLDDKVKTSAVTQALVRRPWYQQLLHYQQCAMGEGGWEGKQSILSKGASSRPHPPMPLEDSTTLRSLKAASTSTSILTRLSFQQPSLQSADSFAFLLGMKDYTQVLADGVMLSTSDGRYYLETKNLDADMNLKLWKAL